MDHLVKEVAIVHLILSIYIHVSINGNVEDDDDDFYLASAWINL